MPDAVDVIELTRQLVASNTINPPGNEDSCARLVCSLLSEAGFAVTYHELAKQRTSVVARRGRHVEGSNGSRSAKPICLMGHLDTVPLGARKWSVNPFAGEVREGKLFGRGSTDTKAGIAAMVAAAIVNAEYLDEGPGAVLVLTAGEETGCERAAQLVEHGSVLGTAGAVIVGEPTSNYPRIGPQGRAMARGGDPRGDRPWLHAGTGGQRLASRREDGHEA
jgi:succinyl-diaminopimelate desuccinylase